MDNMPISVIVVAKNAERTIEDCLDSVRRNNPAEIIVVDGNSTDKTVEIAGKYTDRIYSDEGRGFNYAQGLGAELATQEYIAYVDSDIVLSQGSLATLLAELEASSCISMSAKMLAANLSTYWEQVTDWHVKLLQARRGGGLFATVLKKDTALKYKSDSSMKGGNDLDFQLRVEKDGFKMGTSSTFVYHYHRADMQNLIRQKFKDGKDSVLFIRKYGPWHAGFWPPLITLYWIAICLIKGKPKFIPYFMVDGIARTRGMVKGFFELIAEASRRKRQKDAG